MVWLCGEGIVVIWVSDDSNVVVLMRQSNVVVMWRCVGDVLEL